MTYVWLRRQAYLSVEVVSKSRGGKLLTIEEFPVPVVEFPVYFNQVFVLEDPSFQLGLNFWKRD